MRGLGMRGRSEDVGEVVGEIEFGGGAATEGFAVGELLDVVQAAGYAFVAVGIESEEIHAGTAITAGIQFILPEDGLDVLIDDAWLLAAVGIEEPGVEIRIVIGTFDVAIAERELQAGWDLAAKFSFACFEGRLDRILDPGNSGRITFGDDQGDTVFFLGAFFDSCGFPYMQITEPDFPGYDFCGLVFVHFF